jgi:hypothetical protein
MCLLSVHKLWTTQIPLWTSLFQSSLVTLTTNSLLPLPLWTSLLTFWTSLFQSFFLDQPAHLDQLAHHDVDQPAQVVDQPVSVPCG